jgi:hypothetical protein
MNRTGDVTIPPTAGTAPKNLWHQNYSILSSTFNYLTEP